MQDHIPIQSYDVLTKTYIMSPMHSITHHIGVDHVQWAPGDCGMVYLHWRSGVLIGPHPNVRQLKLPNAPEEGWIIDPDTHDFLDCPCNVVALPAHNGESVHIDMMTCGVGMVINGGRSPKTSPKPFPKCPCRLLYLLLITLQPLTPIPVYYSIFLGDVILVLYGHQEASNGYLL